jgi:NAD-dependent dihydropyrimidine dehydrogenase PreA subunit
MALRNIIKIDEDKCNGCGKCINACAEGAIQLVNGKAKLVSETYCDGLGACIGSCPQDAITVEQREAKAFDEKATEDHIRQQKEFGEKLNFTCPGTMSKKLDNAGQSDDSDVKVPSRLGNWPVQLKLIPPDAPYLKGCDLLLAADCVPFAMGDFHNRFLKNSVLAVGCPKLDDSGFYIDKLAQIIKDNQLKSLMVVHMEVPCCSGLVHIAEEAIKNSGVKLPFEDVTVGLKGNVIETEKNS